MRSPSPPWSAPSVTSTAATARPDDAGDRPPDGAGRALDLAVRAARRAARSSPPAGPGIAADTVVTTTPTRTATTSVRTATTLPIVGSRKPSPASSDFSASTRRRGRRAPRPPTQHADDRRLQEHRTQHLAPAGADGAEQAQLPRPLGDDDGERVVDDERGDEQRHAGEQQQRRGEELQPLGDVGAVLGGQLGAGDGLECGIVEDTTDALAELVGAEPLLGLDGDAVVAARFGQQLLRRVGPEQGRRRAERPVLAADRDEPADAIGRAGRSAARRARDRRWPGRPRPCCPGRARRHPAPAGGVPSTSS